MIGEIPGSVPTCQWTVGGPDVQFDARALVRKLDSDGRSILRYLTEQPDRTAAAREIAAAVGTSAKGVEDCVAWINKLAGALGYVPLVSRSDTGLLMSVEAATVAAQGLIDAQH